jgi:hypothetical protein
MRRSGVRIPLPPPIHTAKFTKLPGDENAVQLVGRDSTGLKSGNCRIPCQRRSDASQSPYLHQFHRSIIQLVRFGQGDAGGAVHAAEDQKGKDILLRMAEAEEGTPSVGPQADRAGRTAARIEGLVRPAAQPLVEPRRRTRRRHSAIRNIIGQSSQRSVASGELASSVIRFHGISWEQRALLPQPVP